MAMVPASAVSVSMPSIPVKFSASFSETITVLAERPRVVPLGIWRLIWVPPMVTTRQPTTKTPMMEAARVKACMLAVRASIALVPSL